MKPCNSIADIQAIPLFSQITSAQLSKHLKSNAEGLRQMEAKARNTGKKVGGFTADQLAERASHYEKMSAL